MGRSAVARGEGGFALASTIGILGVVTLLVIALTSATINATRQAGREVGYSAALGAAEAGVQDFLYRLNSQPDYWRRIPNPDEATNPNPARDTANLAFASFVPVSGAANGAAFTYTVQQFVEVPGQAPEGRIVVTSTGAAGGVTRTVRATLRRETFLDFAYAADKGTLDPALYTTWPPNLFDGDGNNLEVSGASDRDSTQPADFVFGDDAVAVAQAKCGPYWRYSTDRRLSASVLVDPTDGWRSYRYPYGGRHADCHEFQFNNATFDGPFHFNDVIVLRGQPSTWLEAASTSFNNRAAQPALRNPPYRQLNTAGTATPTFTRPLTYRGLLEFPPNNRELRDTAALPAPNNGYLFRGPTRIVLLNAGTPGSGSLYVDSPLTTDGRYGLPTSGKGTLALPPNGVVYVESAPAASCAAGYLPPLGAPSTGDARVQNYLPALADDITEHSCTAGDAYVEGELAGQLTIAAQNDLIMTWHIGYLSSPRDSSTPSGYAGTPPASTSAVEEDVLGLVADGQLRVLKPTRCVYELEYQSQQTGVCFHGYNIPFHRDAGGTLRTVEGFMIHGALLTTQHALNVDNATMGGRLGTLTVVGTLTERFASYVGTPSATGGSGGGHEVPRDSTDPAVDAAIADDCADPIASTSLIPRTTTVCSTQGGLFKQFVYDPRVQYLEPPSFLSPDRVSWSQDSFEERARPAVLPPVPAPSPLATPTATP